MKPEEMVTALTEALGRHSDAEMCWTFVSSGPHGLPVRPRLLTEHENGERVYSLSSMKTVSTIYMTDTSKRSPSHTFVVKVGCIVTVHKFSTREAAEEARAAA